MVRRELPRTLRTTRDRYRATVLSRLPLLSMTLAIYHVKSRFGNGDRGLSTEIHSLWITLWITIGVRRSDRRRYLTLK